MQQQTNLLDRTEHHKTEEAVAATAAAAHSIPTDINNKQSHGRGSVCQLGTRPSEYMPQLATLHCCCSIINSTYDIIIHFFLSPQNTNSDKISRDILNICITPLNIYTTRSIEDTHDLLN